MGVALGCDDPMMVVRSRLLLGRGLWSDPNRGHDALALQNGIETVGFEVAQSFRSA